MRPGGLYNSLCQSVPGANTVSFRSRSAPPPLASPADHSFGVDLGGVRPGASRASARPGSFLTACHLDPSSSGSARPPWGSFGVGGSVSAFAYPSEDGSYLLTTRLRGSPPCSISDPRSVLASPSPLDLVVSFASDLGLPLVPCLSPPDLGCSKYGRLSTCRVLYVGAGTCSSLRLASPFRAGASQRRIVGVQPSSVGLLCPVLNPLVRHSRRSHLLSFSFDSLGYVATNPAPGGTQNATCPSAQGASGANNESC